MVGISSRAIAILQVLADAGRTDFYMFNRMRPEADREWTDARVIIPSSLYWSSGVPAPKDRRSPFDKNQSIREAPMPLPDWADPGDVAIPSPISFAPAFMAA